MPSNSNLAARVLRTPDAAAYTGLSKATLETLRSRSSGGPRFIRIGGTRAIGYLIEDLDAWLSSRPKHTNTHAAEPQRDDAPAAPSRRSGRGA